MSVIQNKNIALDCDGVLLDYLNCYKKLYNELFNTSLQVENPFSYSADTHFGINWENREVEQEKFYEYFGQHGWPQMKALPGAVIATQALKKAGYNIVVVTSIPKDKAFERAVNLEKEGIIFDDVIACGTHSSANGINIKKPFLDSLNPEFFVDDLVSNFSGVSQDMKCVLIDWYCENNSQFLSNTSHNVDIFSTHEYLLDFTKEHILNTKIKASM